MLTEHRKYQRIRPTRDEWTLPTDVLDSGAAVDRLDTATPAERDAAWMETHRAEYERVQEQQSRHRHLSGWRTSAA